MKLIRLDYIQEATEGNGHHLEREISHYAGSGAFHEKQCEVLGAFGSMYLPAPNGLEVVAVFAVRPITKDSTWHYDGDSSHFFEVKAGMLVLSDNHMALWLRNAERSPILQLAHFFHKELCELLAAPEPGQAERLEGLVRHRIAQNLTEKRNSLMCTIDKEMTILKGLIERDRLLTEQYMCIK